jgi:hypothetical protein
MSALGSQINPSFPLTAPGVGSARAPVPMWSEEGELRFMSSAPSTANISFQASATGRQSRQTEAPTVKNISSLNVSDETKVLVHLFDLKVIVAQYSMHLSSEKRERLFTQLDRIMAADSWHDDDPLPKVDSFRGFLKWALYSRWRSWSGIGFSNEGNLLVAWRAGEDRVTAEILGAEKIKWSTSVLIDGEREIAAGICSLKRFPKAIKSNLSERWNVDAGRKD